MEYLLIGIHTPGTVVCYYDGRHFSTDRSRAKRWRTLAGIRRFIEREIAAGITWVLGVLPGAAGKGTV